MKRKYAALGAALLLLPPLAGWLAADQLARPPRRPLQDYHREFLADPAAHGVKLNAFTCSDGTPALVCEPDPAVVLGKRGLVIREQMLKKNILLPPPGKIIGNLLLVHGRRGRKEDYLPIAERFCAVGFRCVLFDLPAHGDHPEATAHYGVTEGNLPALVLHEAAAKFGFASQPAGLMGMSMGGAVSVRSVSRKEVPWRALALISTFDTLDHAVRYQASQWLGTWGGAGLRYITGPAFKWQTGMHIEDANSIALASELNLPVLVAHGTADSAVPCDCGRRLYAALPAGIEKRWVEIPGADHDNVLITEFPIYAEIAEWMLRHVPE